MRKLLLLLLIGLAFAIPKSCPAADHYQLLWDFVQGQTYCFGDYDVVFSPSGVGPAPQGTVKVFDGIYVAPRLECTYMGAGDNLVKITCGDTVMVFVLQGNLLAYVDPNTPFMTRKLGDE